MTGTLTPLRSYAPVAVLASCPGTGRPLTVRFPTGQRGEMMRSHSDCFRCVLATLANVAYDAVPDCGEPGMGSLAITL
jgi:hypothetical protein